MLVKSALYDVHASCFIRLRKRQHPFDSPCKKDKPLPFRKVGFTLLHLEEGKEKVADA